MAKELNNFMISAIAIIGLTAVVLVGMAITAGFSKELRTDTIFNGSGTTITLLINESVAVGSTGTYPFLQDFDGCINATGSLETLSTTFYSINEGDKDGGTIRLNQDGVIWNGTGINCTTLEYLADSSGQSAADKFTTGLGIFGTFSVIIILAIVGKAIISLFKRKD